jgi:hypothetical protein
MFLAARSTDGSTVDSAQIGANLDINIRPLVRKKLRTNDSAKENFLTFRIGYQYLNNVGKPDENRVQLKVADSLLQRPACQPTLCPHRAPNVRRYRRLLVSSCDPFGLSRTQG